MKSSGNRTRIIYMLVATLPATVLLATPAKAEPTSPAPGIHLVTSDAIGASIRPPFLGSADRMPFVGGARVIYVAQVDLPLKSIQAVKVEVRGSSEFALTDGHCLRTQIDQYPGGFKASSKWATCNAEPAGVPKTFRCEKLAVPGMRLRAWADFVNYGAWVDEKDGTSKIFKCNSHDTLDLVATLPFVVTSMAGLGGPDGGPDAVVVYAAVKKRPTIAQLFIGSH